MKVRFVRSDNRDLIWETEESSHVPLMGETVTVPNKGASITGRVSTVHTNFVHNGITVTVRID